MTVAVLLHQPFEILRQHRALDLGPFRFQPRLLLAVVLDAVDDRAEHLPDVAGCERPAESLCPFGPELRCRRSGHRSSSNASCRSLRPEPVVGTELRMRPEDRVVADARFRREAEGAYATRRLIQIGRAHV